MQHSCLELEERRRVEGTRMYKLLGVCREKKS